MRVINEKNGTQQRLAQRHTQKMTGRIDRAAVAFYNAKQRSRLITKVEYQIGPGKRYVRRTVPSHVVFKHPAQ